MTLGTKEFEDVTVTLRPINLGCSRQSRPRLDVVVSGRSIGTSNVVYVDGAKRVTREFDEAVQLEATRVVSKPTGTPGGGIVDRITIETA